MSGRTLNAERRTPNIEVREARACAGLARFGVGRWAFDVRRSPKGVDSCCT